MCLIFWFSAQPADESTEMSNSLGYTIGRLFVRGFDDMDAEKQLEYVQSIDHTIRKCAHAGEYCLLGILCFAALLCWFPGKIFLCFCIGWIISVLYSVTDEVHQIFVPGRACMFTDMLIDASGSLAGVLAALAVVALYKRHAAKKALHGSHSG